MEKLNTMQVVGIKDDETGATYFLSVKELKARYIKEVIDYAWFIKRATGEEAWPVNTDNIEDGAYGVVWTLLAEQQKSYGIPEADGKNPVNYDNLDIESVSFGLINWFMDYELTKTFQKTLKDMDFKFHKDDKTFCDYWRHDTL